MLNEIFVHVKCYIIFKRHVGSVEGAALVRGNHVLDVDECVLPSRLLEKFQSFSDEVAQVESLSLAVLDMVSDIHIAVSEQVKDREDLSVVRDKGLADHLPT